MGGQATNQILLLLAELLKVEECEVSTDDILNQLMTPMTTFFWRLYSAA